MLCMCRALALRAECDGTVNPRLDLARSSPSRTLPVLPLIGGCPPHLGQALHSPLKPRMQSD
jgi:hypothetical protein